MATGTRRMETAKDARMQASAVEEAWRATAQAAPAPTGVTPKPGVGFNLLAASMLSGGLLWACFQPLALGAYLGWIALVPFLVLVRAQLRPRFLYFCAWITGLCFFTPALQWMRVADNMMLLAWFALSIYCALFFPAALFCIRRLERWNIPLIVSVPAVWVAFEYVRCWLLTGFPWYLLAHTQHDVLPMIQIADLGGVFAVSLVVGAVNAFVFDVAWQFPEVRQWFGQPELAPHRYYARWDLLNRSVLAECLFRRNLILEGCALTLLLLGTYAYGQLRLAQSHFHSGPTVCLLQSNLDQRIRDDMHRPEPDVDGHSVETVTKQFAGLINRATLNHHPTPDLLIWPETSYPGHWCEMSPMLIEEAEEPVGCKPHQWREYRNAEIEMRRVFRDLVLREKANDPREIEPTGIPHLIGINGSNLDEHGKFRRYNTALLVGPHGTVDGRFDKIHRVPFGEYIPLQDWLPFMKVFSVYDYDFGVQQGEKYTRFALDKYHFGVLICYEDSDPFMARRYVENSDDGPPVDFFVNISNDGWFDGSYEHEEHLAVSRFRAIECRRAIVRAVNMGVSAVIDGNGRILKPKAYPNTSPQVWEAEMGRNADFAVSDWHKFKKTLGILKATVPIDDRFSFYALAGDWLPIGCWGALLGGAGWAYWRRKKTATPLARA